MNTDTGRSAPLQFVEAALEAAERRKKEEKEDDEMAVLASLLCEHCGKEAVFVAKRLCYEDATRSASAVAEGACANASNVLPMSPQT